MRTPLSGDGTLGQGCETQRLEAISMPTQFAPDLPIRTLSPTAKMTICEPDDLIAALDKICAPDEDQFVAVGFCAAMLVSSTHEARVAARDRTTTAAARRLRQSPQFPAMLPVAYMSMPKPIRENI